LHYPIPVDADSVGAVVHQLAIPLGNQFEIAFAVISNSQSRFSHHAT
jgi:hypothetical protein